MAKHDDNARARAPMSMGSASRALSNIHRLHEMPVDRKAPSHASPYVLVVDDNMPLLTLVTELLGAEGYTTAIDQTGAACLRRARAATPPDLILLDVALPDIDGFSLAQRLRRDPRTQHIPILFMSASPTLSKRFRTLVFSNADFMSKPFSREDLITRVALSLRHFDMSAF